MIVSTPALVLICGMIKIREESILPHFGDVCSCVLEEYGEVGVSAGMLSCGGGSMTAQEGYFC